MPGGNAPSNCVLSGRFEGAFVAGPAPDSAPDGMFGNAELGIICVPATPLRFTPELDSLFDSLFVGAPDAADAADAAEPGGADGAFEGDICGGAEAPGPMSGFEPGLRREAGVPAAAFSNEPRSESTLLTASGETCGAVLGSPTPLAVAANSGGTSGGGP